MLFWQIHEETNTGVSLTKKFPLKAKSHALIDRYEIWRAEYKKRENSVINEMFEGDMVCTIVCLNCKHRQIYFEKFGELSLNLFKQMSSSNIWQKRT